MTNPWKFECVPSNFSKRLILDSLSLRVDRFSPWIGNIVGSLNRNPWEAVLGIVFEVPTSWSWLTLETKSLIWLVLTNKTSMAFRMVLNFDLYILPYWYLQLSTSWLHREEVALNSMTSKHKWKVEILQTLKCKNSL